MRELKGLLDRTVEIEQAAGLLAEMMRVMQFLLGEPQNQAPAGYMHKCQICAPLAELLETVIALFEGGVGVALANVRTTVNSQLQGPAVREMHQSIQGTMAPIREAKNQLLDQAGSENQGQTWPTCFCLWPGGLLCEAGRGRLPSDLRLREWRRWPFASCPGNRCRRVLCDVPAGRGCSWQLRVLPPERQGRGSCMCSLLQLLRHVQRLLLGCAPLPAWGHPIDRGEHWERCLPGDDRL